MTFSLKGKLIAVVGAISAVLLIVGFVVVIPAVKNILTLRHDIEQMQKELEERYQRSQKLKRSVTQLREIKEQSMKYTDSTVGLNDHLKIITQLEEIATRHSIDPDLSVSLFDQTENKDKTLKRLFPKYYKFSFLNTGTFANQLAYIKDLEKLPYYFVIENLSWEKRKGTAENNQNLVTIKFDGIVYVSP